MKTDITKINISGKSVGLIGLDDVFKNVKQLHLSDDLMCQQEILRQVKKHNYIVQKSEQEYSAALWRVYQKWSGIDVGKEEKTGPVFKVLGPGCSSCDKLMKDLLELLTEMNIAADVEHVRDLNKIAEFGLVAVPALVLNDMVICSGKVPHKKKLKELILSEMRT